MANTLENLRITELEIIKLGKNLSELFKKIEDVCEGKEDYKEKNDKTFNLENILNSIKEIKAKLHNLVNEIYSQKNYPNLTKTNFDLKEKEKELEQLEKYFIDINK